MTTTAAPAVRFTKRATAEGWYYTSPAPRRELLAYVRGLARTYLKEASIGGEQEGGHVVVLAARALAEPSAWAPQAGSSTPIRIAGTPPRAATMSPTVPPISTRTKSS